MEIRIPWQLEYQLLVQFLLFSGIPAVLMLVVICTRDPTLPFTLPSLLPGMQSYPKWLHFLLALPTAVLTFASWTAAALVPTMFFLHAYMINFLMDEMKPSRTNTSSPFTKSLLRTAPVVLEVYQTIQVLIASVNAIMRECFLLVVINALTGLCVLCNFIIIQFHDRLALEEILIVLTISIGSLIALLATYFKLGYMHEKSRNLISAWRRHARDGKNILQNAILFKSFQSIQILKIESGNFGCYKKQTSIRIFGKIVFYTAKALMMAKKLI